MKELSQMYKGVGNVYNTNDKKFMVFQANNQRNVNITSYPEIKTANEIQIFKWKMSITMVLV